MTETETGTETAAHTEAHGPSAGTLRQRLAAVVARRPRLWGVAFALALVGAYVGLLRPAREAFAEHVAYPVFAAVDTPRSAQYEVVRPGRRAEAVFVYPAGEVPPPEAHPADGPQPAIWSAPAGVIFLLPAMFLLVAFPTRPYWIYLLGYHLALGVGTVALFALGIGWVPWAFNLHEFARTYVSEGVSLTVPLLLFLAGKADEIRREDAARDA